MVDSTVNLNFGPLNTSPILRGNNYSTSGRKRSWHERVQLKIGSDMQDLEEDLAKLMHLNQSKTEVQLGYYPPNGAQYVRHRDAFPDDGSEQDQRRVRPYLDEIIQILHGY